MEPKSPSQKGECKVKAEKRKVDRSRVLLGGGGIKAVENVKANFGIKKSKTLKTHILTANMALGP